MPDTTSQSNGASDNLVTVAIALRGRLAKTVFSKTVIHDYDAVKFFRFMSIDVTSLQEMLQLVKTMLHRKHCCLLRGVTKDDTIKTPQQRKYRGAEATLIDRPQNWFALDVDSFGKATDNLKNDAQEVLFALGLLDVECFAMPTSSRHIKDGMRIRLFFWNNEPISCDALKRYFLKYKDVIDASLLHPIQPIYTARPIFKNDMVDPCQQQIVWLTGNSQFTNIENVTANGFWSEEKIYTKPEATRILASVCRRFPEIGSGFRHHWLYDQARLLFKCCATGVLDADEVFEELLTNCSYHWDGNQEKDEQTILDAKKAGYEAMDETTGGE